MNELTTDHYRALLGLDADWRVTNVEFLPKAKLVDIRIEYCGSKLSCPECKCSCPRADMAPERTWRHLDTMQFTTTIHAAVPEPTSMLLVGMVGIGGIGGFAARRWSKRREKLAA